MLIILSRYIEKQNTVTLKQLSRHFEIEAYALEPLLEFLERKKIIKTFSVCRSSCAGCNPDATYIFCQRAKN